MIQGSVAPGLECVAEVFARTLDGSGGGAAFAATVDGVLAVDIWGGVHDPVTHAPWDEGTMAVLFSGTKGVVATCMLLLVARGELELDAPVAHYWPEFAAGGKEDVLVRHVLAHTAGVPGLRQGFTTDDLLDSASMTERVAAEPAFWPPGERLAYHALTFGWICGELIRRIDGRSVGRFIADEIAQPLELDLHLGLPARLEPRVATLVRSAEYAVTFLGDEPALHAAVFGGMLAEFRWNEPAFHAAEIPGGNGIATARALARLYGCLAAGGELAGRRLLDPGTVSLASRALSRGPCAITGRPYAYGAGFELQTEWARFGPAPDAFGHTGSGGSTHGAWPKQGVGFSFLTSELRLESADRRGPDVLSALYESL